jgi:FemAB-related protein (PEP-CTERM system-associated)
VDWKWLPRAEGETAWDQGLELFADAPYSLLYGWRRVYEEALGLKTHYLLVEDRGRVRGLCPLVLMKGSGFGGGRHLVSLPYQTRAGLWTLDPALREEMLAAVSAQADALKAETVELREWEGLQDPEIPANREHVEMILELPGDWKIFERQVSPRLRQARKARQSGLVVRQGVEKDLLEDFYRVFSMRMRELVFPVYPLRFFQKILQVFPNRCRLLLVYKGTVPLAGMLLFRYRDSVSAPYVASLTAHQNEHPNQLLYQAALRDTWESGAPYFSFCRSQPDSGTFQFKRQWKAQPRPLRYLYPRVKNNGRVRSVGQARQSLTYRLAATIWPRLPLSWTQWLGSRLIRRLVIA